RGRCPGRPTASPDPIDPGSGRMIPPPLPMRSRSPPLAFASTLASARAPVRALVLAAALAVALAAAARAEEARVTLLHTTDLHGALTPWDYLEDRPAVPGLTKVATLVRALREGGPPAVLVDAGDCIQGGVE